MNPTDPHDLERFVGAGAGLRRSLRRAGGGRKRSHWMWFVFPQLAALGRSATAQHYGIGSLAEARAYGAHPVLGPRLLHCTALVLGVQGRSALQIFHAPDHLKFCSCMTLFKAAAPQQPVFGQALARFYGGEADGLTLDLLAREA